MRLFETRDFQQAHRQWVEIALRNESAVRDARWSEAVAVCSLAFVEKVKSDLGIKALHRELEQVDGTYALRESGEAYRRQIDSKHGALTTENTLSWERIA
jgi:REP-associated tyrosine transposase